jgi:hypothetical protein
MLALLDALEEAEAQRDALIDSILTRGQMASTEKGFLYRHPQGLMDGTSLPYEEAKEKWREWAAARVSSETKKG